MCSVFSLLCVFLMVPRYYHLSTPQSGFQGIYTDEIMIKTAKTKMVTAVVVVVSIFSKKRCDLQNAKSGNEKPFCQKAESVDFLGGKSHGPRNSSEDEKISCQKAKNANFLEQKSRGTRNLSPKIRKGQLPKKLSPKSKKLELNSTNLNLKSKKTCSDCTK
jgi:hypothetical protein